MAGAGNNWVIQIETIARTLRSRSNMRNVLVLFLDLAQKLQHMCALLAPLLVLRSQQFLSTSHSDRPLLHQRFPMRVNDASNVVG
jgi:hypothetical protein